MIRDKERKKEVDCRKKTIKKEETAKDLKENFIKDLLNLKDLLTFKKMLLMLRYKLLNRTVLPQNHLDSQTNSIIAHIYYNFQVKH